MEDRRDYPGLGGRARRRSLRHPAGTLAEFLPVLTACCMAAAVMTACGEPAGGTSGESVAAVNDAGRGYEIEPLPPEALVLEGAAASLDDLLRVVERGLAERDTTRLLGLMINEREYRDILFPAFPASHPPINARFEIVWMLQYPDSYRGLERMLERYGGREIRITDVRFDRPDQDFVNFLLHETSRVDVTVDGEPLEDVRLFGSVVRIGDQWKVLTYTDDPDPPS